MKHNPMGINRGLYSLEKLHKIKSWRETQETQEILWSFSKIVIVEPNILVVSWRQICDNPLATKVWGANII